jgi:hypothetical protein
MTPSLIVPARKPGLISRRGLLRAAGTTLLVTYATRVAIQIARPWPDAMAVADIPSGHRCYARVHRPGGMAGFGIVAGEDLKCGDLVYFSENGLVYRFRRVV